jgi:hypothetical protein
MTDLTDGVTFRVVFSFIVLLWVFALALLPSTCGCTVQVGAPNVTVKCVEIVANGHVMTEECTGDAGHDGSD